MAIEKALEVCKVSPPPGSPTDISLALTFFDLLWLRYLPTKRLFFYESPHQEPLSILSKLKHSLSITLKHFLPLAGNIAWPCSSPNPLIRYKEGDGVLFTVVESDADFHHLSGKTIRECGIYQPLAAHIVGSDSQVPVFVVKVTIFPNKGFCIGIAAHHGVLDGKSVALFMKSWASISKLGGLDPKLTPIFNRKPVGERYTGTETSYFEILRQSWVAENNMATKMYESISDKVRGSFELSGLEVKNLKKLVSHRFSYISTFTITFAYIILCIVKIKGPKRNNKVFVGFPADMRGRLEPQLPSNYFGNCIALCDAMFDREELMGREGMEVLVEFISESIKTLDNGVLKKMEQSLSNAFKERNPDLCDATHLYVVGSSKFGFQEVDFGWGRPKKVDISQLDKLPAVAFTDLEDGGVGIELSLNKLEMERFSSIFLLKVSTKYECD